MSVWGGAHRDSITTHVNDQLKFVITPSVIGLPWRVISLFSIVAALCGIIGLEVFSWCTRATTVVSTAPVIEPGDSSTEDTPDGRDRRDAWLNEILARPLFTPGRHPDEGRTRGLPRLTGVIVAGPQRLAIFSASSDRPLVVVQVGGYFGDYEVRGITELGVAVVGPRGKVLLTPTFEPMGPLVRTAPPTPGAPGGPARSIAPGSAASTAPPVLSNRVPPGQLMSR